MPNLATPFGTVLPMPPFRTSGDRGASQAADRTAQNQTSANADDDHAVATRKAKAEIQALSREARKCKRRLAKAHARLEKLKPKDRHERVNAWLEASTGGDGKLVQEARPSFDQDGFPIPNQQWRKVEETGGANSQDTKKYDSVAGKRVPLIQTAFMRARDFRRQQEKRSKREQNMTSASSDRKRKREPSSVDLGSAGR
ncbi:hypothetical protein CKM354_000566600 [Cercospora kikuchii]|uniref:Uncharacterized protein n=1 Tax=Cercospora kikuchii TaxID=84275 RepID=A0A9P3FCN0_9PEZI|nr:uncharacterized protein CKM354_000566600 [Cercospora kikuchii]GIZ42393.1 hypothetical protein CKM354_000566600 [Cercospora kikuchii]